MSRGGIFVHSRQPFPVGTQLKLNLQLLDGTPLIVGEGTVFWTREPDANKPQTVPGMGVRFSKLTGHSQRVIELVLSQRTGRERSGLFPTLNASMVIEESGRHPVVTNTSKSKLPFNVFPGNRPATGDEARELLANAGKEETTPLVGVSAATLADARPGKDEPPSKAAAAKSKAAAEVSGTHDLNASKRPAPALALIRPATGEHKSAEVKTVALGDSGKLTSSGRNRPPTPAPLTSTQELAPSLGASQSGLRQSGLHQSDFATPAITAAASLTSSRFSNSKKMIIGAAAVLAVTITIFAATRGGPTSTADAGKNAARTTIAGAAAARSTAAPDPSSRAAESTAMAHAPAAPVIETGSSAPALEPEATGASSNGKSSGSSSPSSSSAANRLADRRAPKGKPAPAHRPNETAPAGRSTTGPSERPPVAEAPARVEPPAPVAPAAVVRAEPPPPVVAHVEPAPAPKSVTTVPPPVATTMAHKLRLTSIPSEADVELDGRVIGRTPLFGVEVDVSRSHTLMVRKDGFAPFKQTIGASSEWSVRAAENTATLRIQAFMKKQ